LVAAPARSNVAYSRLKFPWVEFPAACGEVIHYFAAGQQIGGDYYSETLWMLDMNIGYEYWCKIIKEYGCEVRQK
jgi:hypothetical protein